MKALRIPVVALFSLLALGAIGASSASAQLEACLFAGVTGLYDNRSGIIPDKCETLLTVRDGQYELYDINYLLALWLANGSPVISTTLVETEGELELTSLNGGGLGVVGTVLCSDILDGWVGSESLGFISELLTLAGGAVSTTELSGTALLCTNVQNCSEPSVWADKLGWETLLDLRELVPLGGPGGTIRTDLVDLISNAGWYIECKGILSFAELCESAENAVQITNETNGTVDSEFSDEVQEEAGFKLGNCSIGGSETAEVKGLVVTTDSGVTLSVSSE